MTNLSAQMSDTPVLQSGKSAQSTAASSVWHWAPVSSVWHWAPVSSVWHWAPASSVWHWAPID